MIIQSYPDELDYVNAQLHPLVRSKNDQSFLGTFCLACLRADGSNYQLLRPVLHVLMEKYPADRERLRMERLRMERHDSGLADSPVTRDPCGEQS